MGLGPLVSHVPWQDKLRRILNRRQGARVGEAAVLSRQVHMSEPHSPQKTIILTTADAGEVFYGRADPGEVIHLDIFHAVAEVDHVRVAAALRQALPDVPAVGAGEKGKLLLDYFDLVTATGGGRVTGDLTFGKKASLRAAHRNHVHLAGLLPDAQMELVLPIVAAVENEIRAQGVETRRVEKLCHVRWTNSAPMDLSDYTDCNDSLLRGENPRTAPGAGGSPREQGTAAPAQSLRRGAGGTAGADPGTGGVSAPGEAGGDGAGLAPEGSPDQSAASDPSGDGNSSAGAWGELEAERRLQTALDLSRRLGSPDEVKRVLDELSREQGWATLYNTGSSQAPFLIRQLEEEGLVRRELRGLRLTEAGQQLAAYMACHLRDVKLRFRKLIRRLPTSAGRSAFRRGSARAAPSADVRYGTVRGTAQPEPGAWLGDLAVPETVCAAIRRNRVEQVQAGHGADRTGLGLQRQDVRVYLRTSQSPLNICLLIDASASMAGRRILAAKHLARHLLVSTRDRIAVIAFQERDVRVYVPFTRDYALVESGLSRIQPLGLTPLAHGLTQSMDLIRESRVRRPLLLLITDGIPTVPKWTVDPLTDALEAARQVGKCRIPFGCIGLQPSRRYLEELVRTAGGTLHVVEELDEDLLVTIAHQERLKTAQKGR